MKLLCLMGLMLFSTTIFAQTPPTPVAQCGPGEFVIQLSGKPIGAETYNVECPAGGGFHISGTTTMDIDGTKIELASAMETDAKSVPAKFSMKGHVVDTAVDQDLAFNNGTATGTNNGKPVSFPFTAGAAMLPNNISYTFQFILNRYDQAKGSVQEIILFPSAHATLEFVKSDDQPLPAGAKAPAPKLNRYELQLGALTIFIWTDAGGKVMLVANPTQKFAAIRKEFLPYADALQSLVAPPKLDYSAPAGASFTAEEVTVQAKGHTLAGTLLLPKNAKGKVPAVITITGSGQQTRDEPLPFPNLAKYLPFRQIAEALAARGIAVLRVDDRGVGGSTGQEGLQDSTTFDFADDTRAQVAYLRTRPEIDPDRIALAGHSEGGVIAPMVAADDPKIAAIVCLAGTGQRGDVVLLYQFNRPFDADTTMSEADRSAEHVKNAAMIKTAMEGGDASNAPPILRVPWTRAFLNYDPLPAVRKVKQPMLILQGSLDQQVVPANAELLRKAAEEAGNHAVEVHVFPGLNHLFLPAKTGDASEYSTITVQELPPDVIGALTDWLVKTLRVK
jgi:dienelactone hydrolase